MEVIKEENLNLVRQPLLTAMSRSAVFKVDPLGESEVLQGNICYSIKIILLDQVSHLCFEIKLSASSSRISFGKNFPTSDFTFLSDFTDISQHSLLHATLLTT